MSAPALLGVDVGTSAVKVVAFDLAGRLLARGRAATPTSRLADGRAEHDADTLWACTAALIAEVTGALGEYQIEAVAATSVGEAGFALDSHGRPVRPGFAWFDARGDEQVAWWAGAVGASRIGTVTGQVLDAQYSVNRLLWLREHEPRAFARTRHWLSAADLVVHRLSGGFATDHTLASRTMCFDQQRLDWSNELLELAALEPALFPQALASGTRVGGVTAQAAAATGLTAGTPVVTGGHDRLCAAFAARGPEPLPVDSTGSAEAVVLPIDHYVDRIAGGAAAIACYADVVPGQYVLSARVGHAGALVDWFRRELQSGTDRVDHRTVDAEVGWPLTFSGLLCYPSFGRVLAPHWDPATVTGAILGLTVAHRRAHLLQALIEGVGFSLRANLEALETLAGRPIPVVRSEGTLIDSRVWMQLKAEVTGRRVDAVRIQEATALGAALLAGVGAGVYADHAAAAAAPARTLEPWAPSALAGVYDEVYERGFKRLPGSIADVAAVLGDTTGGT